MLHGRVVIRGKEKRDANVFNDSRLYFRGGCKIYPQCGEDICRTAPAAHAPVAVLDHRATGSRSYKGRSGADVEGLCPVTSGTAGVDKHPARHGSYRDGMCPHHPGKGRNLGGSLALHMQRKEKCTNLRL